jgi:chromosome segregation protein
LAEHTAEATARVELLTTQETGGRQALAAIDEALRALRIDAQSAQEQRSQIELELVRKQSELKYLDETSSKELNATASEIAAAEQAAVEEGGVEEAEQRYQEVRARIEALGPVNPQALEEFQEAQQRYEFPEHAAPGSARFIRDTEKAIQELDTRIAPPLPGSLRERQRALQMFQTLFGGGPRRDALTDESNPLPRAASTLMASPPARSCSTSRCSRAAKIS